MINDLSMESRERLLTDLEFYWTDEERESFKDAPEEWILQCYNDSDVMKYGPNIRKITQLVESFSDQSSSEYQKLVDEIEKHREFLNSYGKTPKSDFIRLTLGDLIGMETVLQNNGYTPCSKYLRKFSESLPSHNIFVMYETSGFLLPIFLALQAERLVKWEPLSGRFEEDYFLDSDLYSDAVKILHDCGYRI